MALPDLLLHNFEMPTAACLALAERKGLLINNECIAPEIRFRAGRKVQRSHLSIR
jgi:hypothetical protein